MAHNERFSNHAENRAHLNDRLPGFWIGAKNQAKTANERKKYAGLLPSEMKRLRLHRRNMRVVLAFLAATFLLGAGFVTLEAGEFLKLVSENAGPDRSAFLSAFFVLVGTHGLHVTCGLIWMLVLVFDMTAMRKGLSAKLINRLVAFGLFWHFLDIIWICLFTFVYLSGFLS